MFGRHFGSLSKRVSWLGPPFSGREMIGCCQSGRDVSLVSHYQCIGKKMKLIVIRFGLTFVGAVKASRNAWLTLS
jgi:hypothetical protein